ncbi:PAS domain S-box protein [Cyclobacterium roseum]|uniref:PAS domain S-box protein n=1 Tax=Cyclobacterium roseum TaxID=2666137 RepID=UPI0013911FB0|nr:PAS domain S-box protein [Cyclobacterium roseum]
MEQNQYSDLLLDQTKDLIWAVNKDFYLVYANSAYQKLMKEVTGVEKALNTPIWVEGFGEGYIEKWKAYYQRALSGTYFEIEEHFYNPETKEIQYGQISFSPIRDEEGEILTVACRNTDITSVIRQKDHASRLMDASLDVFCTIDEAGNFVFVSAASAKHWGYPPEELIGKPYRELILEEDLEKTDLVAAEIMAGREFRTFSNRFRMKHGGIAYNLWSARWDHESKRMYCVARDAKEKIEEEAEKELHSQISLSFNTEEELIPAANRLCENLYVFGKFDLIELWCPNMERTQLKRLGHSTHKREFYELEPSEASFQKNEGLPGKVWETGKQLFWDEKQIQIDFIRKKGASHLGLQAILGIPLTFNDELVGVLLIGTRREPDYLQQYRPVLGRLEKFIGSEINRKRMEDDLKHLYQAIPDILCMADFNGRFLKMNPAGCDLLGYNEDEILFHSFDEFVHPEDKDISTNEVKQLEEGATTFKFENRYLTKAGQIIWLSWSCNSAVHEGVIFASAKNITEEVRLRELNKQASSLAKIGSWEIDVVNNKLFWTDMVHVLHETDPLSFIPDLKTGITFYREDFRDMVKQRTANCMAHGTPFNFEAVLVTAKNNERWVRCLGNPEFLNGKCIRVYGSFQDIHDRKTFEEVLRESETKFRTIFEIASLGIAQVSPADGQILFINSYYEEITGYSYEELLQMKFPELTHPGDRKRDWDLFSKAARGEIDYRNEKRYIRKDGSIVWVRIHLAFIRDEGGNPVKTVAICENITERKEIEYRLKNLSDNVPGVVFQYVIYPDEGDALNYVSKGSKSIWGFEPEEAMANNRIIWDRIEAGGDLDLVKGSIADSIRDKSRWNATWKYPLPTGEIRTHIGHGSPEFLADGTVVFNSMILDITEEKRTEDLLNQASSMAKIGSWELNLVDQDDDSMYWSPMTREVLEVDDSYNPSLTGGFEFYAGEDKESIQRAMYLLIEAGQEFDLELLITTQSGKEKWIRAIGKSERINGKCTKIYGSFQDIHAAKSNELRVKEILDSISDAFYAVDAHWNFTYFNKEAENLLKKSADEVLGRNLWEIFYPANGTFLEEVYRHVASTGQSENFEYQYPGNGAWYEITTYPSSGGISSYFKNIDERKKAAQELEKAYRERNEILESISDAFFAVDESWTVTYWNKQAESILGRVKKDMVGKNLWEEYPDAIDSDFYRQYHQAMDSGETVRFEEYYPTLDIWIEVTVYPSENGLSIYFKDITLRKAADIRLVNANQRFELATQATNDAIWDWDIDNDTFVRSTNISKFFGNRTATEMNSSQFWQDHFHQDDLPELKASIQRSLDSPDVVRWEMEYRILNEQQDIIYVKDRGVILRDENGKPRRMVGAMTDLTRQKKLQTELNQINESLKNYAKELERSNEELEQFAFITSHDLQEPLRMISSFMDQLRRKYADQLDDKALQYIHYATDGAKRMKQIILDLLLYSRANKLIDEMEEVNLNRVLSDYRHLRRKLIAEKSASFKSYDLPSVRTYKAPLAQIFHSLLDNALKYSKDNVPPQIEIQVSENEKEWEFAIKDNGIGIEEKFFEKIFVIFQRLHNREQYEGTGIGLSIVKKTVTFLGGKVWLKSTVREGTTFYFTIAKNKKEYEY